MQAVSGLGLLADNVENRVDELGSFSVVTLGPVVSGTALSKDKVVGTCKKGRQRVEVSVASDRARVGQLERTEEATERSSFDDL